MDLRRLSHPRTCRILALANTIIPGNESVSESEEEPEDNYILNDEEWNEVVNDWDLREIMNEDELAEELARPLPGDTNVEDVQDFPSTQYVTPRPQQPVPSTSTSTRNSERIKSRANMAAPTPPSTTLTPPSTTVTPQNTENAPNPIKRYVMKQKMDFSWKKEPFSKEVNIPPTEFQPPDSNFLPIEYFEMFTKRAARELIAEQTNLYSTQKRGQSVNTTTDEIGIFIGVQLLMGVVKKGAMSDYWDPVIRCPTIADALSLKRYKTLHTNIHFVDNSSSLDPDDRFAKVRPILDHVRQNCLDVPQESRSSIDEMVVPYKGKKSGGLRQYNPKKPKKWGFKFFVRAGVSGIIYDILPYAGESTFFQHQFTEWENRYLGIGQKVVIVLCKTLPSPLQQLSCIYMDNWFTSLELQYYLRHELGILSLGTIRANRTREACLSSDKELKKEGRGSLDSVCDNKRGIVLGKWLDNKSVNISSTYVGVESGTSVQRYCKVAKKKVSVPCPKIISDYNMHMGGVDKAGMLVSLYRSPYRSKRYYMVIFSQMMDICVNNGWLLYVRHQAMLGESAMRLKQFRIEIALSLIAMGTKPKVGRPLANNPGPSRVVKRPMVPRPNDVTRTDQVAHFAVTTGKNGERGRCKLCQKKTPFTCNKCLMHLCILSDRNCFFHFHHQKKKPKKGKK